MRHLGHVPALDGLRGIAVLLVLAVHTRTFLPGGRLGVDLFFVLSGFLITALLLREWDATGRVSLRAFYRRRLARLVPALAIVLAFYALVFGAIRRHEGWTSTLAYGATYLYNAAWGWLGHDDEAMDHLWSLAAEEQFYIVWPPLLLLALHRRVPPRVLVASLVVVATAFAAWRWHLAEAVDRGGRMYAPDAHADPIVLGCIAGLAYGYGLVRRVPFGLVLVALVLAMLCVTALPKGVGVYYHGVGIPLFCMAATIVVLACALHRETLVSHILALSPLRWLGKISYGLYLWHFPLFALLGWKLGAPVAVLVAAASYYLVEAPIVRWGRQRRQSEIGRRASPRQNQHPPTGTITTPLPPARP